VALRSLIVFALGALAMACTSVNGSFHATGASPWRLEPNMCESGLRRGYFGVDLYRRAEEPDDTELVALEEGGQVRLLARLPGRGLMVRLTRSDCDVLDVDIHTNPVKVNGVRGLSGHATIDCRARELGRLAGSATFACY
jgi:hypothetical protein